jgi:hypothetical protein
MMTVTITRGVPYIKNRCVDPYSEHSYNNIILPIKNYVEEKLNDQVVVEIINTVHKYNDFYLISIDLGFFIDRIRDCVVVIEDGKVASLKFTEDQIKEL